MKEIKSDWEKEKSKDAKAIKKNEDPFIDW
jgi:hypothetical protein